MNQLNNSRQLFFIVKYFTLVLFFAYIFGVIILFHLSPELVSIDINRLSLVSLVLFCVVLFFSLIHQQYYWLLLPVAILNVPNAVNDLFPSVLMAVDNNYSQPYFSLFTHIDIYLLFGVVRYAAVHKSTSSLINYSIIVVLVIVYAGVLYLTSLWRIDTLYGTYQIRYFILMFLLFTAAKPLRYTSYFTVGLGLALFFLLAETLLFTWLNSELEHFVSGNLGKNPLGHFSAAILCFFLFNQQENKPKIWLRMILILLAAGLLIGSDTRFSMLVALVVMFIIYTYKTKNIVYMLTGLILAVVSISVFIYFTSTGKSLLDGITYVLMSNDSFDSMQKTAESSSMITRLHVWFETASMISDNLIAGLGPGGWAYEKQYFNIPYGGLIDPHNDFLHMVVSYGLPFGVIAYFYLLIFPLIWRRDLLTEAGGFYLGVYTYMLVMFVTGLTNATIWKHQLFALSAFMVLSLYFSREMKRDIK